MHVFPKKRNDVPSAVTGKTATKPLLKTNVVTAHPQNIHYYTGPKFIYYFFFLRDFIFKKTLFEKLQYLKQKQTKNTKKIKIHP